ncbi:MAG: hypothetical protein AABY04_03335, partial [Candidatus Micrarchaeota archaeon]
PLEAGGIVGALQTVQLFNIGPYKESPNKKDLSNIDSIYESFYKNPRSEKITLAEPYGHPGYCVNYAAITMPAVYGAAIGSVALSAWSNIGKAFTVAGAPEALSNVPYLVKSAYYVSTTLSLCTVSIAQQAAYQPKDNICQVANDCIAGGLAGGMESLFTAVPGSGTGKIFAKKFITELVQTAGVTAIIDAGLVGYNAIVDADVPAYVPTPVAYGVARIYRTFGTKAFFQDYLMRNGYSLKESRDISKVVSKQLAAPLVDVGDLKDLVKHPDIFVRRYNANLPAGTPKISSISEIPSWDDFYEKIGKNKGVAWDLYKQIDPADYNKIHGPYQEFLDAQKRITDLKKSVDNVEQDLRRVKSDISFYKTGSSPTLADLQARELSLGNSLSETTGTLKNLEDNLDILELRANDKFEQMIAKSKAKILKGTKANTPGELIADAAKSRTASLDDLLTKGTITQSQYDDLLKKANDLQTARATRFRNKLGGEYSSLLENNARLRSIFQLVLPMLFHIDVRPVQGALDFRYVNHIVSYSGKDVLGPDGSMSQICVLNYASGNEECTNIIDPNKLCDSNKFAACMHLVKGRKFSTEDQGYALLVGVNGGIDFKKVSESVFLSSLPPLNGKELGNNKIGVGYFDDVG